MDWRAAGPKPFCPRGPESRRSARRTSGGRSVVWLHLDTSVADFPRSSARAQPSELGQILFQAGY
jgi:hypothetical protein